MTYGQMECIHVVVLRSVVCVERRDPTAKILPKSVPLQARLKGKTCKIIKAV